MWHSFKYTRTSRQSQNILLHVLARGELWHPAKVYLRVSHPHRPRVCFCCGWLGHLDGGRAAHYPTNLSKTTQHGAWTWKEYTVVHVCRYGLLLWIVKRQLTISVNRGARSELLHPKISPHKLPKQMLTRCQCLRWTAQSFIQYSSQFSTLTH